MYEHFTDSLRKVIQFANMEAQKLNHECQGTEHLLLGLIREDPCAAMELLKSEGVNVSRIPEEVRKIVQPGPTMITMGKFPQTPRAKKVIEYAMEAADSYGHSSVGTEHLLIGLLKELEGVAGQVLIRLGAELGWVSDQVASSDIKSVESPAERAEKIKLQYEAERYKMSAGGPAFPTCNENYNDDGKVGVYRSQGMTLRDWFAGQVLKGLLLGKHNNEVPETRTYQEGYAIVAYEFADAMLAERAK